MAGPYTTERQITAYLTPRNHALFRAYVKREDLKQSEFVNSLVKKFFDAMSPKDIMALLNETKHHDDKATWPV